jgi:hypothetical protein
MKKTKNVFFCFFVFVVGVLYIRGIMTLILSVQYLHMRHDLEKCLFVVYYLNIKRTPSANVSATEKFAEMKNVRYSR